MIEVLQNLNTEALMRAAIKAVKDEYLNDPGSNRCSGSCSCSGDGFSKILAAHLPPGDLDVTPYCETMRHLFRGIHPDVLALMDAVRSDGKIRLGGAYLSRRNFCYIKIPAADFRAAILSYTYFRGATLHKADFRDTDAVGASFANADLRGANFSGANLRHAIFSGAKLRGTEFRGANLNYAVFDPCAGGKNRF
jgi:hypothetical protein